MKMTSKAVAIIPARGGSKRIPRKNIKTFLGKEIISYSIEAALESNLFSDVMVSTDDEEIAFIAKKRGANIPFMRSKKNSSDHADTASVIVEVLMSYMEMGKRFDYSCCIYPAAPFVTKQYLKDSYDHLIKTKADSLFIACKYSTPVQRAFLFQDNKAKMLFPEYEMTRSQDLPPLYYDAGQLYWHHTQRILDTQSLTKNNCTIYIVPSEAVQDIDNFDDWKLAETKFRASHST